jgi:Tfp pilus assembly protein PilF
MIAHLKNLYDKIRPHLLPLVLLIIATFAVYIRMLGHQFLTNWDDNRYVLENLDIQGFDLERLKAVFTSYYVGNYAPVQMLSYMLDFAIWGFWPGGYLLTNLVIHLGSGILLYRLLLLHAGGRSAAFFGAAVFLLHPVQVESVAWISQRKNVLAMLFFLVAWVCYSEYRENSGLRRRYWYAGSLLAILLALLAKSVAVIFPVVILLYDRCYPPSTRRFTLKDKIPYVLAAGVVAILALLSQTPEYEVWGGGGGRSGYHGGSALTTFFSMIPVVCRYLGMIVWPSDLSAYYKPTLHVYPTLPVILASLVLAAGAVLLTVLFRRDRRLAFWPLVFFIGLLPVSQIVPLVTMMNDRYLYFPMIGVAGLVAMTVRASEERFGRRIFICGGIPLLAIVALAVVSCLRVPYWKNAVTLWQDTVAKVPGFYQAWEALGESYHYYNRNPDYEAATNAYLRALELYPDNSISWYNLGVAYTEQGKYADADAAFAELLRRYPGNVMGWSYYGDLAQRQKKYAVAEQRYRKALSLQPEAIHVYKRLAGLQMEIGRIDEVRKTLLKVDELEGGYDSRNAYDIARLAALAGDTSEAIRWLEAALQRGYTDFQGILNDEVLLPIISDGRFDGLVQKYFSRK